MDPCDANAKLISFSYGESPSLWDVDAPASMREWLDGSPTPDWVTHLVIHGTYLPGTVRCTAGDLFRIPAFLQSEFGYTPSGRAIKCYMDIRANAYILGSGPSTFTALLFRDSIWRETLTEKEEDDMERSRNWFEHLFNAAFLGREHVMFFGPPVDISSEAWKLLGYWDVKRRTDGTVIVENPETELWETQRPEDAKTHRSKLEMELPAFTKAVTAAHQERVAEYGGRIGADPSLPMLVSDVHRLRDFYTEIGTYASGAPTPAQPPPPYAKADIGKEYSHELFTVCGVGGALFDGRFWMADPPLDDGDGNPPPGWGDHTTKGVMALVHEDRAVFTSNTGQTAEFVLWSAEIELADDWPCPTPIPVPTETPMPTATPVMTPEPAPSPTPPPSPDWSVLVALYEATDGPNWKNNANWLSDKPLDTWHGVRTDGDRRVIWLHLHSNQLAGPIPPELGNLDTLKELWLSNNQLTGEIPPTFGNLVKLETLDLYHNQLTGSVPAELGNLSDLPILKLGSNRLTGPIPPEVGNLVALKHLSIDSNQLTGVIPPQLGNLARLENLSLGYNQLTGSIPAEFGDLSQLKSLSLRYNQLTGPIPPELGNLTDLESLSLSDNRLTGEIPSELGYLEDLDGLYLGGNALTGPIPSELGQLHDLNWLNLRRNALTGSIPPELGNLSDLENLWLSDNGLTGQIPEELGNLARLQFLILSNNHFTGCVPANLSNVPHSDFDELGLPTCPTTQAPTGTAEPKPSTPCSNGIVVPNPAENPGLVNDCIILLGARDTLAGTAVLEWNAETPISEWPGVYVWDRVESLHLEQFGLNGTIPPEFGELQELMSLGLSDNRLTGEIPPELGNLFKLVQLSLQDNNLIGEIPAELGALGDLWSLHLDGNSLLGAIPPEIGNLKELTSLSLADNQLTGEVPSELGNLDDLEWLNLENNALAGEIPRELGNLEDIQRLTMRNNRLTGRIPLEFGYLYDLVELSLRGNQLSGCVAVALYRIPYHDLHMFPVCEETAETPSS